MGLLADAQPGPALEERLLHSLRASPRWNCRSFLGRSRLAWAATAAAVFVVCGAVVGMWVDPDILPFPGAPPQNQLDAALASSRNNLKSLSLGAINAGNQASQSQIALTEENKQKRIQELMAQYNTLWKEAKFREAEGIAVQAQELDPDNATVAAAANIAKMRDRQVAYQKIKDGKEDMFLQAANESEREGPIISTHDRMQNTFFPAGETSKMERTGSSGGLSGSNFLSSNAAKGEPKTEGPSKSETPKSESPSPEEGQAKADAPGQPAGLAKMESQSSKEQGQGKPGELEGQAKNQGSVKLGEEGQTIASIPGNLAPPGASQEPLPAMVRKVIRTGEIDFEVESYDAAVASITRLVTAIKGAFISSDDSKKLSNGKIHGSLVVRVPPESLDGLVLDLRKELGKNGELKGQRIGSQDITKQYTDMESRLKGERTAEGRWLEIIKTGKGEIKDILQAEKELDACRTRIEGLEGEIRYFANLVALSTLTVNLTEKEMQAAAAFVESERVQMGLEVEDVDKSFREVQDAVTTAKGRMFRSEVKQHAAGQLTAFLSFEVAPAAAGPLRDRLKQIGTLARLNIDRDQKAVSGSEPNAAAPLRRGDTRFEVSLYNVMTSTLARESDTITLAVPEVPASYQALREVVSKVKGRVLNAQLDEQNRQQITAHLDVEVRRGDVSVLQDALERAGEVISRKVTRAPEGDNVSDTKVRMDVTVISVATIKPRETTLVLMEVNDVEGAATVLAAQVSEVKGRAVLVQVNHETSGQVSAHLIYDVPLTAAPKVLETLKSAGTVRQQTLSRNQQAPEGKAAVAQLDVRLANVGLIVPPDEGLWPRIRMGLTRSATLLAWSVTWLIVGICVVLPWTLLVLLLALAGWWMVRLFRPTSSPTPPVVAASVPPSPQP